MKLVKPSIEFLDMNSQGLKLVELAGRTCYKSEDKITADSHLGFAKMLKSRGHHAMLEFGWLCYKVICDRGVTHEIVRHRLFSYAQESTRYCNYKSGVTFIIPSWLNEDNTGTTLADLCIDKMDQVADFVGNQSVLWYWIQHLLETEYRYIYLLKAGWQPQQARSILPNSLKTEIVIGGNFREWIHFFNLRTAKTAHPQMQEVANMILADAKQRVPVIFDREEK
jgi:thymidylate synthase (FAD)